MKKIAVVLVLIFSSFTTISAQSGDKDKRQRRVETQPSNQQAPPPSNQSETVDDDVVRVETSLVTIPV